MTFTEYKKLKERRDIEVETEEYQFRNWVHKRAHAYEDGKPLGHNRLLYSGSKVKLYRPVPYLHIDSISFGCAAYIPPHSGHIENPERNKKVRQILDREYERRYIIDETSYTNFFKLRHCKRSTITDIDSYNKSVKVLEEMHIISRNNFKNYDLNESIARDALNRWFRRHKKQYKVLCSK